MPKWPVLLSAFSLVWSTAAFAQQKETSCVLARPGPGFVVAGGRYVLTSEAFGITADVEGRIKQAFGNDATIADWQSLKRALSTTADVTRFIDQVGIPRQSINGPCDNFLVSNDGRLRPANGVWTFLARHDGRVPGNWAVLDSIEHHKLDLGRWFWRSQALVFVRENSTSMTAQDSSPLAMVKYDGKKPATLRYGDLSITIHSERAPGDDDGKVPFAIGKYKGHDAFSIHLVGDDARGIDEPEAEVRLIKLDPNATEPQVIFTYYWNGAHCCTVTQIATMTRDEVWHVLNAGTLDGDGYQFKDLDQNGGGELISIDNSFLYAFGCYACSSAPTRIKRLVGAELMDVTSDSKYQTFLRQRLHDMEVDARNNSGENDTLKTPGYLGGWVAAKALIGEFTNAWQVMLDTYQSDTDWTMEKCEEAIPVERCPESEKREVDFPHALAAHLLTHGYITDAEYQALSFNVLPRSTKTLFPKGAQHEHNDTSSPLGLCAAAINDPLRPMIIDILISGGKHIGPDWTAAIKEEIENDYGSFITVRNDATVEGVDVRTGKVGCSVTYQADLQGLAAKVLDEGANARARILLREIAQEGKAITRRLQYTVQSTSGGSFLVQFGLANDAAAPPARRRRVLCVLVLNGRCAIWRR